MQGESDDITGLLTSWREGDRGALDRLLHLIDRELQRIARRHLAQERQNHTMQPSSLVQEAFLRLFPGRNLGWRDRAHFFRAASCVMRHILVDHARQRSREKRIGRGGGLGAGRRRGHRRISPPPQAFGSVAVGRCGGQSRFQPLSTSPCPGQALAVRA